MSEFGDGNGLAHLDDALVLGRRARSLLTQALRHGEDGAAAALLAPAKKLLGLVLVVEVAALHNALGGRGIGGRRSAGAETGTVVGPTARINPLVEQLGTHRADNAGTAGTTRLRGCIGLAAGERGELHRVRLTGRDRDLALNAGHNRGKAAAANLGLSGGCDRVGGRIIREDLFRLDCGRASGDHGRKAAAARFIGRRLLLVGVDGRGDSGLRLRLRCRKLTRLHGSEGPALHGAGRLNRRCRQRRRGRRLQRRRDGLLCFEHRGRLKRGLGLLRGCPTLRPVELFGLFVRRIAVWRDLRLDFDLGLLLRHRRSRSRRSDRFHGLGLGLRLGLLLHHRRSRRSGRLFGGSGRNDLAANRRLFRRGGRSVVVQERHDAIHMVVAEDAVLRTGLVQRNLQLLAGFDQLQLVFAVLFHDLGEPSRHGCSQLVTKPMRKSRYAPKLLVRSCKDRQGARLRFERYLRKARTRKGCEQFRAAHKFRAEWTAPDRQRTDKGPA